MRGRKAFAVTSWTLHCIKKESPNEGTKSCHRIHHEHNCHLIKKESPNEGTKLVLACNIKPRYNKTAEDLYVKYKIELLI